MTWTKQLESYIEQVETFLSHYLQTDGCVGQEKIVEAMRYSALAGGKRLRPAITLEFCRISGGKTERALPFAVALEMIHTYSLIHDDLPCMDNDDLRRGQPTNHKVYGEAMAVLAGDALLTQAFELASNPGYTAGLDARITLQAIHCLAQEAGVLGMIGGQVLDLQAEGQEIGAHTLMQLQERKTGALIRAAAQMGCLIGGASEEQTQAAIQYAEQLGLAFQIQDDILDIEGDEATLGKPIGSDEAKQKSTFPALLGLAACHELVHELTKEAIAAIETSFEDTGFLAALAQSLADRQN